MIIAFSMDGHLFMLLLMIIAVNALSYYYPMELK